jgi:hypothetical protein
METLNGTDLEHSTSTDDEDDEAEAPAKATPKPRGTESPDHSYEDGWYQVLKRRADESDEED